jgi:hypothetical protein
MPLKWVANSADRKPDFDIDDAKPGQVVTLQIAKSKSFKGRWLFMHSMTVAASGPTDYTGQSLDLGTWYARHRVNGGRWGNVVTLTIAW